MLNIVSGMAVGEPLQFKINNLPFHLVATSTSIHTPTKCHSLLTRIMFVSSWIYNAVYLVLNNNM